MRLEVYNQYRSMRITCLRLKESSLVSIEANNIKDLLLTTADATEASGQVDPKNGLAESANFQKFLTKQSQACSGRYPR